MGQPLPQYFDLEPSLTLRRKMRSVSVIHLSTSVRFHASTASTSIKSRKRANSLSTRRRRAELLRVAAWRTPSCCVSPPGERPCRTAGARTPATRSRPAGRRPAPSSGAPSPSRRLRSACGTARRTRGRDRRTSATTAPATAPSSPNVDAPLPSIPRPVRASVTMFKQSCIFRVVQVTKSLQDPLEVGNNLPGISDNVRE